MSLSSTISGTALRITVIIFSNERSFRTRSTLLPDKHHSKSSGWARVLLRRIRVAP